jgi:UDP-N-acetylmuramoyl-tripeptide--D-alanyl-D-alanine ligase
MISMSLSEAANRLGIKHRNADVRFAGCSIDSRTVQSGNLFIAIRGERFDGHGFVRSAVENGACAVMTESPDADDTTPLLVVKNSRTAMAALAASWRSDFQIPLIAVTGSNGKTTVKEMISSILGLNTSVLATRGNLNNDIGVPLTLFGLGKQHQFGVIEMGANHPGEIAGLSRLVRPDVAVITQCAPAHLEGFGSIEGVATAKSEIYSGLVPEGCAVVNADDEFADYWRGVASAYRQLSFGIAHPADITANDMVFNPESGKTGFTLTTPAGAVSIMLPLAGRHNVLNALAAVACCTALGLPIDDMKQGLERMTHVHGRMQMKVADSGARVFDDTYNANPASLRAGLQVLTSYPGKHWLILGDMGELGEFSEDLHRQAGEMAREQGVERVYALGRLSRYAVDGFGQGATHFTRMEDLLTSLKPELGADITLLVKGSRFMAMDKVVTAIMEGS